LLWLIFYSFPANVVFLAGALAAATGVAPFFCAQNGTNGFLPLVGATHFAHVLALAALGSDLNTM
jgi:hypothetical protein